MFFTKLARHDQQTQTGAGQVLQLLEIHNQMNVIIGNVLNHDLFK